MAEHPRSRRFSPERFKAFVDAVVAIAMTLLILPLLEAVSDAAKGKLSTAEFFGEHSGQLVSFALSFALIANFWLGHHRQYDEVTAITRPLLWINIAWMLTIVWLPVPTAMLGQMDTDALQKVVYIGTLILTQVTTLAARLYLLRHRDLTTASPDRIRRGVAADFAAIILFGVALGLSVLVGAQGYLALLVLLLTGMLSNALYASWTRREAREEHG